MAGTFGKRKGFGPNVVRGFSSTDAHEDSTSSLRRALKSEDDNEMEEYLRQKGLDINAIPDELRAKGYEIPEGNTWALMKAQVLDNFKTKPIRSFFVSLFLLGVVAAPFSSKERAKNVGRCTASAQETMQNIVRLSGYRCDAVNYCNPFVWGAGFDLSCNNFRYNYSIADRGGRPVVSVK